MNLNVSSTVGHDLEMTFCSSTYTYTMCVRAVHYRFARRLCHGANRFNGLSGKTSVTAIVAYIGDIDLTELQYDKKEVELVFTLPISHLCDPQNHGYTRFDPSKSTSASTKEIGPYVLPVFRGAGYHIWGLTAVLTDLTLGVLAPDHYKSLFF
ncbi:nucleoside diphosphate-linked moiety X motif 8-like isoform X2 [Acanthaster planci]|uniref:Nucleoside diphosphate-linked moiety X motif 8-like isoform X2 n=1 Tax=Acanthaster planci TaxID=133434 RepID=A0A8B7YCL1_ACAPL|nr:nucleoside diphosphate-linked moiety X motif 8-like isoform X2 [Acanthaster planci]